MKNDEPTKAQLFYKNMMWMINSGEEAEAMSTKELVTAFCDMPAIGQEHVSSLESAITGEVIYRLQHPLTWKLRRWLWDLIGSRVSAWNYRRKIKSL